jgi:carbonic anhydrase
MIIIGLIFTFVAALDNWDYNQHGADWNGKCSDGKKQSPVNIRKSKTNSLGDTYKMEVYYYGTTMSRTVKNDGNKIYLDGNFGYITIRDNNSKDRKFITTQIAFHAPSEHEKEGVNTHMEMQIYHKVDDSDYTFDFPSNAVVSVLLRPGDNSYFFDSIQVNNLPTKNKENVLANDSNINLISIVEADDNYFFYHGSNNEPDCDEDYLWYVFEKQQWISFVQINYFLEKLVEADSDGFRNVFGNKGNNREIQGLNGRTVYYSFGNWLLVGFVFYNF